MDYKASARRNADAKFEFSGAVRRPSASCADAKKFLLVGWVKPVGSSKERRHSLKFKVIAELPCQNLKEVLKFAKISFLHRSSLKLVKLPCLYFYTSEKFKVHQNAVYSLRSSLMFAKMPYLDSGAV